jgi:hypothetical protein
MSKLTRFIASCWLIFFTCLLLHGVFNLPTYFLDRVSAQSAPADFPVNSSSEDSIRPKIVIASSLVSKRYTSILNNFKNLKWHDTSSEAMVIRAANYVSTGLEKVTGRTFQVVASEDLSKGIIITTFASATDEIRNDPQVKKAFSGILNGDYSKNELFLVKTQEKRTLVVANTVDGLLDGVVELMESIGYEALGMGPNWTYTPNYKNKRLYFNLNKESNPSYYIRGLNAVGNQGYGLGTVMSISSTASDEPVSDSYWRWLIGARIYSKSMPAYPGHALYKYHKKVLDYIRENKISYGFLSKVIVASDENRPSPSKELENTLWVNSDKVFWCDGKKWLLESERGIRNSSLDLSAEFVRQIILEETKKAATLSFQKYPDRPVILGVEPEDGGGERGIGLISHDINWYPKYLSSKGFLFGQPYKLNNFNGFAQESESWDSQSPSDTIYGFSNWLLKELDAWIDQLPIDDRLTYTKLSKKSLLRCSLYSYNYHDVLPSFNLDPRVRVMVGSYAKNRGKGKWSNFKTQQDIALALKVMLPNEPLADYRIISLARSWDIGYSGIRPRGHIPLKTTSDLYRIETSTSAKEISKRYQMSFSKGYRAISFETDLNFGKQGLEYYLTSKMLWNANVSSEQLNEIRNRWFKKSFGSGWKNMRSYYDFMLVENYPQCNRAMAWVQAARMIDSASKEIEAAGEVDALKRIDDVKQYWYNLYLFDTKQHNKSSREFKTYLWKGQMSYMVAMHALLDRYFKSTDARSVVGQEISSNSAHYTHEETEVWWGELLAHWASSSSSKCL